uniref:Uncharacterized protein n=1 Tax=Hordeum vulgare subsp. vulgare TaxID=112509 RepID=A0A8I6XMZ7_HORVV
MTWPAPLWKIVTDTIKKNAEVIKNLGDKYRGMPEGSMWDVCVMVHDIAAGQLEIDARPSFNRGDYAYASDVVSVVKGVGDACENAFKEVHRKSPLTDMDRQTTERCGVAIDLLITNSK